MTMIATKAAPAAHGFQTESKGRLRVSLAVTPQEVHMAQRLRYAVFAEELGAKLHSDERDRDGARLDVDHYGRENGYTFRFSVASYQEKSAARKRAPSVPGEWREP